MTILFYEARLCRLDGTVSSTVIVSPEVEGTFRGDPNVRKFVVVEGP